ncbi:MAG: hypothetical protein HC853_04075 [Anaerolineae bacterium]|nr:hypothetical protein [Anaerolineae bacterium]
MVAGTATVMTKSAMPNEVKICPTRLGAPFLIFSRRRWRMRISWFGFMRRGMIAWSYPENAVKLSFISQTFF